MVPAAVQLRENQTVAEAAGLLAENDLRGAPVLSQEGILQGVLTQTDIDRIPSTQRDQQHVNEAMKRNALVIHADETLDEVLAELTTNRVSWAPVVEQSHVLVPDRRVIGVLSIPQMVRIYRETIVKDSYRIQGLDEAGVFNEWNGNTANVQPETGQREIT